MSSDELNISSALSSTPVNKKRKRKNNSSEDEGSQPKIFGNLGTPMPSSSVQIEDPEEWEEWKKKEVIKKKWKKYVRSKWDLRKDELPMKSDSKHLKDRYKHYENIQKAQEQIAEGIESLNERHMNVGIGEGINVQVDGKNYSKKKNKKFAAAVDAAWEAKGKPTIEQMCTDDLDDEEAKAEAEWAAKFKKSSARAIKKQELLREMEEDQVFDPWEEYCCEMEEKGKAQKIEEEHYKKWLNKKIDENKVSKDYNAYQLELLNLDKNAFKDKPQSLRTVVKNVRNFYRNLRDRSSNN